MFNYLRFNVLAKLPALSAPLIYALAAMLCLSERVYASPLSYFKDETGHTKWQYVANFSGSVLIVLLSITLVSLLVSRYKLALRNRELREIKKNLEQKVAERTENLNQSNRMLRSEVDEHKATQSYLSSILASMPSMLIGLDNRLRITHWNATAESISGLSAQQVLSKSLWEVYPAITVSQDQVQAVLDSRQPATIKHSQRGQYYFDITVYPLAGSQDGVVIVVENVTQRSLAENMLIQRDKMASMGELAATMAHDINAPLQQILSDVRSTETSLQTKKTVAEADLERLNHAIERGTQASAVIQNLLEFSGSHGAEKHAAQVTDILDHCLELAHSVLSDPTGLKFRDIRVSKDYEAGISAIQCYVAELQQVFMSVFRNACQALTDKAQQDASHNPELKISVNQSAGALWVKIHHNGSCLSPEEQQEIFEPFVQQTTPVNPKPLLQENRLSFSYFVITEHHDGELAVTSSVEQGTTFHIQFYLPSS